MSYYHETPNSKVPHPKCCYCGGRGFYLEKEMVVKCAMQYATSLKPHPTTATIKGMDIISILILLLIVGVVVYFAFWMVDASGIPSPFNWLIKGVVLILGLLWLFGGGSISSLPSLKL